LRYQGLRCILLWTEILCNFRRSVPQEIQSAEAGRMKVPNPFAHGAGLDRREMLLAGSVAIAASFGMPASLGVAASPATERPKPGDRLVVDAADESKRKPVVLDMVPLGGPLLFALPVDAETGTVRDKSRFNKLALIRLAPEDLDEETRKHAAEGVVAYSAICTHQGCTLSGWKAEERTLACFCHLSEFSATKRGRVVKGPATRRLPILPLALGENGELVVAGEFTSKPGFKT
jgi:Rieske Fe-S protein